MNLPHPGGLLALGIVVLGFAIAASRHYGSSPHGSGLAGRTRLPSARSRIKAPPRIQTQSTGTRRSAVGGESHLERSVARSPARRVGTAGRPRRRPGWPRGDRVSGWRLPWSPGARRQNPGGSVWADRSDLRALICSERSAPLPGRLVIGSLHHGGRRATDSLAVERAQSLAVIGPTQSGKTTSLAVPAILGWDGPVLAVSVKTDLLRETWGWRAACGQVQCFDPTGVTGRRSDQWSPLIHASSWSGARRAAADLTESARTEATTADGEFWYATATKLLAPILFAAATGGRNMSDVVRWVDTQEVDEVLTLLESAGVVEALHAAQATWSREERQRSAVYTTAETVLEGFAGLYEIGDGGQGAPGDHPSLIEATQLLDGPNTLYVCAPAHDQRRLRGLFSAVVKDLVDEAFTRATANGGPLDPPLLIVLDEAANIAPLAELDGLAATCAGHGIQLVTIWQDLAQITARYGARAATVVNNHRAKLFLSGIADPGTLEHASTLVGDEEVLVPSLTRDASGGHSTTTAPSRQRLLPPDALRRLAPGTAVLVYGALPPARVVLRPWWADPELARRGGRASERGSVSHRNGVQASRVD